RRLRQPGPVALAVLGQAPGLAALARLEAARGAARRGRDPRGPAAPGQLASRPAGAGAALAGQALAGTSAVPGVGPPADGDRRRHERLAEHAGPGAVLGAGLLGGHGAAVAFPVVPGVYANWVTRQTIY